VIHVIWEFTVSASHQGAFETAYKGDGLWAQLFRQDPAYRKTILIKDGDDARRYLTVDVWQDRESYARFKDRFAAEYRKIDQECEALTESERFIGIFSQVV
jgi:quinol monooxygenase YgiN